MSCLQTGLIQDRECPGQGALRTLMNTQVEAEITTGFSDQGFHSFLWDELKPRTQFCIIAP